ncbi:MAG: oligosaccharide flippase family protein [Cytophagales bacterium]|nr:oligosaccharide flippase family protein [Rhizobacter sp.]
MKDTLRKLAELALNHVANFAFPLVFAILCGRVLGVHDFGIVSFYTALAAFLGVIIEFGFDWLGIREVSQADGDSARQHSLLCNVTAAKLLIGTLVASITAASVLWLRGLDQWMLVLPMAGYMLGFSMDVSWYLRALERTRVMLAITTIVRLLGIALLWTLVSRPGDMGGALWTYAFVSVATSSIGWFAIHRQGMGGWVRPQFSVVFGLMRRSSAIVFGNLSGGLLTNGGVALLGLSADPATVGAANLALRVRMAGQAVLLPIKQLTFVRLSALARSSPARAVRVGRMALAALLGAGLVIAVAILFAAEFIVRQVFLGDYPVAVGLIMLLGLSIPLNAAAELFGMQCLIAFGQERSYALVVVLAAAVFCGVLLLGLGAPLTYGWALLAAEASLAMMAGLRLRAVLRQPR